MQMVKKVAWVLLIILLSLVIFAPKRELYYLLEEHLGKYDIVIHNEKIEDNLLSLKLRHLELYAKGIKVAYIDEVSLFPLLFDTEIVVKGIKTDASLHRWIPEQIDRLSAGYRLWSPQKVSVDASGTFGKAQGEILLDKKVIHVDLIEEKSFESLKPLLKKGEKGWYYETSF